MSPAGTVAAAKESVAVAPAPIDVVEVRVAENTVAPEPKERVEPAPSWIGPAPVFLAWSAKLWELSGSAAPGASDPATYASEGGGT